MHHPFPGKSYLPIVLCLGATLACPRSTPATTVEQLTDEQLTGYAQYIVEGEVLAVEFEWNADQTQIQTIVTVRVDQVLKGELPDGTDEITLHLLGGDIDDMSLWIPDMPTFEIGELVVLYLAPAHQELLVPTVGMNQGKVTLVPTARPGQQQVKGRNISRDEYLEKIASIVEAQRAAAEEAKK